MALFEVDPDKCIHDGLCQVVCPAKIIELIDAEDTPVPVPDADELCINCGHCMSVCPTGALTLNSMNPSNMPEINPNLMISPEQAEQLLRSRRSMRVYADRPVDRALLERLIAIADSGPSAANIRPVEWLVIHDTQEVKRLGGIIADWMRMMLKEHPEIAGPRHFDRHVEMWDNGVDRLLRGAPHVVLTHAPVSEIWGEVDSTIALTYLELAAYAFGLGACWAGYLKLTAAMYPPMLEALALPEGHHVVGAMMIGHPDLKYARVPDRGTPRLTWR
jgi:nitroreductase/NAD-dependent dihydropyrimidine dehydrogenase PreA subunit